MGTPVKISALTAGTTPAGTEVVPAVQSSATVKFTLDQILGYKYVAKGDSLFASASGTAAKLTVGSNGQAIQADSTQASGVKWASSIQTSFNHTFSGPSAARTYTLPDQNGTVLTSNALTGSALGFSMTNGTLVPSQNGTVLTVAIKTLAGADPSATDPVYVLFRNVTTTTGDYTVITLTAATSIATTVGGTFGVANSVAFRLWIVGFNDGGTFRLALINCLSTVAGAGTGRDVTAIYPLSQFGIASATQIGAGSTLSQTFYSFGAAVSSKAYATLGYLTYELGLATAGTFGVNQSRADLFRTGVPLPGTVIQTQRNDTGAMTTGTTLVPFDDTIPLISEGDQYMTQAITPTSAANVLNVTAGIELSNDAAGGNLAASIYQDATTNALKTAHGGFTASGVDMILYPSVLLLAAGTVATTFKIRAGSNGAGTTTFNGRAAGRIYGGVMNSYMQIEEKMA